MGDVLLFRITKRNDDPCEGQKYKMIADLQSQREYGFIELEFPDGSSIMIDAKSQSTFRIWSDNLKFVQSKLPLRYIVDKNEKPNSQVGKH